MWYDTPPLHLLAKQFVWVSFSLQPHQDNEYVFILRKQYSGWILRTWSRAGWNVLSILSSHLHQWWQVRNHQSSYWGQRLSRCHQQSCSDTAYASDAGLCSGTWGNPSVCWHQKLETHQQKQRNLSDCEVSASWAGFHPHPVISPLTTKKDKPTHGQTKFQVLLGLFLQLSICSALWSLLTSAISINTFLRLLFTWVATSEAGSLGTR